MSTECSSTVARVLKPTILILIAIVAISSRLFSIIRFESVIHEFDPWFNYRTTQRMLCSLFVLVFLLTCLACSLWTHIHTIDLPT